MIIQLQFLNYLLESKDTSLLLINNIDDSFFSDYAKEFNFIYNHINQYGCCPDKETFLSYFPDFDIIQVNDSPDYLIDALFEDRYRRHLVTIFNQVRDKLNTNDVEGAMKLYTSSADVILKAKHISSVDVITDISRYGRYVDKIAQFNDYYVKTGFDELDKIIGGWDRKEELATIVARTNMGKSWFLLKTALAAAQQGLNVGLYSGEMSEDKVGYRLDTLLSHISNAALTHGSDSVINDYKRYIDNLSNAVKGHIRVFTPEMNDGLPTVTQLRAFIECEHLDMLCIDQHSLLADDKNAKNPVERASNISKDLKSLQVMKKIPIITVSQQNRESTENGIDTTHISQSDRIGQDSTIVIAFEQKDNILTLNIIKSRDSARGGVIKYAIDLDHGIFRYIPVENDHVSNKEDIQQLYNEYEYSDNELQPF